MKAGRELDALVAKKVFGCVVKARLFDDGGSCGCEGQPHELLNDHDRYGLHACGIKPYSTDIAAAWEVVEKLKTIPVPETWVDTFNSFPFVLRWTRDGKWEAGWEAMYYAGEHLTESATAPLAICLAALNAVGHAFEPKAPVVPNARPDIFKKCEKCGAEWATTKELDQHGCKNCGYVLLSDPNYWKPPGQP